MTPFEMRNKLAEYADGELTPSANQAVETLLKTDPESRAVVERWRALRRATRRAVMETPVPAGLDERLRASLQKAAPATRPRIYRLGFSGLAVAAAIMLALFVRPQGARATSVPACGFGQVYRLCALEHRHDSLHVRLSEEERKTLGHLQREVAFRCKLPDVTVAGYQLEGACTCPPCTGVQSVHAYFRNSAEPHNIVSAFAVDRPIRLCREDGKPCPACRQGHREYRAATDGQVEMIAWQEGGRSYVMCCGRLNRSELIQLAEQFDVAAMPTLADLGGKCLVHAPD